MSSKERPKAGTALSLETRQDWTKHEVLSSSLSHDAPDDLELEAQLDALAREVLAADRDTLMVTYRFFDRALWKMPFAPHERITLIGTDGEKFYYDSRTLLNRYRFNPTEAIRDHMHLLMHCVLYHPFIGVGIEAVTWDLACDVVAEGICVDLLSSRFPCEGDEERRMVIQRFQAEMGNLSAEKIYRTLYKFDHEDKRILSLRALFTRDDHWAWYGATEDEKDPTGDVEDEKVKSLSGQEGDDTSEEAGKSVAGGGASESGQDDLSGGSAESEEEGKEQEQLPTPAVDAPSEETSAIKGQWEEISKQLKNDLESAGKKMGMDAGSLQLGLSLANRPRHNYRDFLRRFMELGEELMVNDDEFDLVFYTYGLQLYGNMPLIEPLEYRELPKIREFVIAIDTSGSTQGEQVRHFVEETYAIMKASESFFSKVHVHIIQSDARVQEDALITDQTEFEDYIEHFELKGGGGTDFRPVFDYVDHLVHDGELTELKGLIYFTDGLGIFPAARTEYDTVFLFVDQGQKIPEVPPWAYRLIVDPWEFERTGLR